MINSILYLIFISSCTYFAESSKDTTVIIVGAGPAGIATATRLLENGIDDLLILEAEHRIGGRIFTTDFNGRNIDLGAEWCHGEKDNIVHKILEERNLLDLLQHDEWATPIYLSSRRNISDEFTKELWVIFNKLYYVRQNIDDSLGSLLHQRYTNEVTQKYKNNPEQLEIALWAEDLFRYNFLSSEGALSWYDSSPAPAYEECEGDTSLGWKDHGYRKFLDILMKDYPDPNEQLPIDDKILINKEVIKINTTNFGSEILCSDNSTYTAKHVIFTPSLGVLKHKADDIFVPKLPQRKMNAIERLGFGAVVKVFLEYETNWWGDAPGFSFIWTNIDRQASKEKYPRGPITQKGESWIVCTYNVMVMSNSNILLIWYTGDMVPLIEDTDDDILEDGIQFTLNLFLEHLYKIPKPRKIIKTSWYSNPHFLGTYSYRSINSTSSDLENLQQPILNANSEPILQFAGEATHPNHFSTVHGAVESGYREADRLIKLYQSNVIVP